MKISTFIQNVESSGDSIRAQPADLILLHMNLVGRIEIQLDEDCVGLYVVSMFLEYGQADVLVV